MLASSGTSIDYVHLSPSRTNLNYKVDSFQLLGCKLVNIVDLEVT